MFNVSKYPSKPMLVKQSGSPLLADRHPLFDSSGLSDQDIYQIHSLFDAIQSGRVKVIDSSHL